MDIETIEFIFLCIAVVGNLFWGAMALRYYSLVSAPNLLIALKAKKKDAKLAVKARKRAEKERDEYQSLAESLEEAIVQLEEQGIVSQPVLTTMKSVQVKLANPVVLDGYIESFDRYGKGVEYAWPWVLPSEMTAAPPDPSLLISPEEH